MARSLRTPGHLALMRVLTQAQLAARLRCQQSFVARIETGQRRVDAVELVVLARVLGVPAGELLAAVEEATPEGHRI